MGKEVEGDEGIVRLGCLILLKMPIAVKPMKEFTKTMSQHCDTERSIELQLYYLSDKEKSWEQSKYEHSTYQTTTLRAS